MDWRRSDVREGWDSYGTRCVWTETGLLFVYLGSRGIQNLCFLLLFFFFAHYFRSSLRLILHRLANEPQLAECSAERVMFSGGNQTSEHTVGDNQPQTQCQKV